MRGFAADVAALADFAAEMGVPLIEDAVPALGAELDGRKLGTFGLAGAFSTQSDKSLNCGEGGFLVTDDTSAVRPGGRAVRRVRGAAARGTSRTDRSRRSTDLTCPCSACGWTRSGPRCCGPSWSGCPTGWPLFHRNYDYVAGALADVAGIAIRQPVAPGRLPR